MLAPRLFLPIGTSNRLFLSLGFGLGLREHHHEVILASRPPVEWLESVLKNLGPRRRFSGRVSGERGARGVVGSGAEADVRAVGKSQLHHNLYPTTTKLPEAKPLAGGGTRMLPVPRGGAGGGECAFG